MISHVTVVGRSPEDVMSDKKRQRSEESYKEEEEEEEESDTNDGNEAESSLSETVPKERHTKAQNDLSARVGSARAPSDNPKLTSPVPAPNMKRIATKPRKASMPKIKVVVPVASM